MSADFRRRHSLEVEDELSEIGRDEDADRERYEEERQERFRRDIDRHIFGRGGKLKLNIAKTRLALRDEQHFNQTMKKLRVMEKPGASARSNKLDAFYDNSPEHLKRIKTHGMGSQEAGATSDYVSQGTKIRPPKPDNDEMLKIIGAKIKKARELSTDKFKEMRIDKYQNFLKNRPEHIVTDEEGKKASDYVQYGVPIRPKKPTQKERARIIQAKIKQALEFNAEDFLSKNFHKADRMVGHGLFIHPNGELIEANDPDNHTHYGAVRTYAPKAGLKLRSPFVEEEDIHDFLKKTGTVRLNNSLGVAHLHIATRLTQPQISTIKDYEKRFDNFEYGVGDKFNDVVLGTGTRSLLRDHAKAFGQKQAQEEDINVNMTYTKSKKVKLLKEMFRDQRTAKSEESIALFKRQKLGPEHEEGFGFDPRHGDFVTPQSARERYGKPGVALHFIATTDNAGPVENISRALDAIGDNHFIGGWKSSTGFKTDASYIINTNDPQEVISHLKRHNQEASYSIDASGNPYFIRNPHFVKH